jgi:hypothetical protein
MKGDHHGKITGSEKERQEAGAAHARRKTRAEAGKEAQQRQILIFRQALKKARRLTAPGFFQPKPPIFLILIF